MFESKIIHNDHSRPYSAITFGKISGKQISSPLDFVGFVYILLVL